jgi:hypothetical protein
MRKQKRVLLVVFGVLLVTSRGLPAATQSITPDDIKRIISNQPDFMADYCMRLGKEVITIGLAKRDKSFRLEMMPAQNSMLSVDEKYRTYKFIVLELFQQPRLMIDPQERIFSAMPAAYPFPSPDIESFFRAGLRQKDSLEVLEAEVANVDGRSATKIKLRVGNNEEVTIYIARDLKDLIVKFEGVVDGAPLSFSMSNISMNVPQDLFEAPKNYQKVDFDSFQAKMKQKFGK